ncbi:YARHG domain-containing protein [Paraflavitalea speifideaquila]|uniref:YARHG domain-containing protein n=1 Tax=Paraflavitalea speifideaquila TaxID=3076558 RepID=UPI0028E90376|nr:YARHG domain-containing protein [Paraflavitalea speifideiaquila]
MGSYHFGESESEWSLIVMKVDTRLIMQSFAGHWGETKEGEQTWVRDIDTYDTVELKNGRFKAGALQGIFTIYLEPGQKPQQALILTNQKDNLYTPGDTAEMGFKDPTRLDELVDGKYPQLSYKLMEDAWFKLKSKEELQLMRNEIFARYGMRFVKGGKIDMYFRKQDWYRPGLDNVMHLLNEIERKNIAKIQRFEKE